MMMFLHLVLVIVVLVNGAFSREEFLIKHKTSGKYMYAGYDDGTYGGSFVHIFENEHQDPGYSNKFYLHAKYNQWGHIYHVATGQQIHPEYGSDHPADETLAWLGLAIPDVALFALDQINNRIIHIGGSYLHPYHDQYVPPDVYPIVFRSSVNLFMEWEFVNPNNPDEVVFPYGNAMITGEWKMVFCVIDPHAEQTRTYTVSIGLSETDSITSSFQYAWEGTVGVQDIFASMSSSTSLTSQIESSSSETWHAEITRIDSIKIPAGETVAVWQLHFIGEQSGHKGVHGSDIFAHTNSPFTPPDKNAKLTYL